MARIQAYWENNGPDHYKEGPYVLVPHPWSNQRGLFRIEKYCPDVICAAVDATGEAARECKKRGLEVGWNSKEVLAPIVDALNARANAAFWEMPK